MAALVLAAVAGGAGSAMGQVPAGSSFTYQGRLVEQGSPYTGAATVRFNIYNADAGGTPLAPAVQRNVNARDGLFQAEVDFGMAPFMAWEGRWVEIAVRLGGGGTFTTLPRRVRLTPVPFSMFSFKTSGIEAAPNGNVGIGRAPANEHRLAVRGSPTLTGMFIDSSVSNQWVVATQSHGTNAGAVYGTALGGGDSRGVVGHIQGPNGRGIGVMGVCHPDFGYAVWSDGKLHATDVIEAAAGVEYPSGGVQTEAYNSGILATLRVPWGRIDDIPSGFADGIDNDTTYSAGAGLALTGTTFGIPAGGIVNSMLAVNSVGGGQIEDNAVRSGEIADGQVTSDDIANDAVRSGHIKDGEVTDPKIVNLAYSKLTGVPGSFPPGGTAGGVLDGSYPNPGLRDGAVTNADLAIDAVTSNRIADGTVTDSDLANDSVTSAKIVNGAVTGADLANNSVDSAKIVDQSVTNADLANDSVTSIKIANGQVTSPDLASDAGSLAKVTDGLGTVSGRRITVQPGSINVAPLNLRAFDSQLALTHDDGPQGANAAAAISYNNFITGAGPGMLAFQQRNPSNFEFTRNFMVIRFSSGNVGIGTDDPQFLLHVNGSAGKPDGGSWSNASDARLKKNVKGLEGTLDRLLDLHGVSYEYIDPESIHELSGTRIGMIAQEVETVFPHWVDMGADGYRRVTYRGFEAITVEALRDLRAEKDAQIAALQAQNESDADRIAALEAAVAALVAQAEKEAAR